MLLLYCSKADEIMECTDDEEGNEMMLTDDDGSLNNTMVLPYTTLKKWRQRQLPQQQ
jgi:hypothetical protein